MHLLRWFHKTVLKRNIVVTDPEPRGKAKQPRTTTWELWRNTPTGSSARSTMRSTIGVAFDPSGVPINLDYVWSLLGWQTTDKAFNPKNSWKELETKGVWINLDYVSHIFRLLQITLFETWSNIVKKNLYNIYSRERLISSLKFSCH